MEKLIRNNIPHGELYEGDKLEWEEPMYDIWDGTHEIWSEGDGSYSNPFRIKSAKNLAYLSHIVATNWNAVRDKVIRQEVNIDLNNIPFTPIGGRNSVGNTAGNITATFTYQGNGKRIKNIKLKKDNSAYHGLFGLIWYGSVSDLKLINVDMDDSLLAGTMYSAGLVGMAATNCNVSNCHILGESRIKGRIVGGIVGGIQQGSVNSIVINNCSVGRYVEVITTTSISHFGGGIAGYMSSGGLKILNCVNHSNVKTLSPINVGGCIGGMISSHHVSSTLIIEKCVNFGNLTNGTVTGGICGFAQNSTITKCVNLGNITGFNAVGGIVSEVVSPNNNILNSCFNLGRLTSINNKYFVIGGIIGLVTSTSVNIINSYNIGKMDGHMVGDNENGNGCAIASLIGYVTPTSGQTISITNTFAMSEIKKSNRLLAIHGSLLGYVTEPTIINLNNVFTTPIPTLKPVPNHPQYDNTEVTYEYLLGNSLEPLFGDAWEYNENKLPIIKL